MKEYRLELKIKNNYLLIMMEGRGFKNAAELSRASGVGQFTIGRYLNLSASPFKATNGEYKETVLKIADCLDYDPEFLFPENYIVEQKKITAELDFDELKQISMGGIAASKELSDRVDKALDRLSPREREVIDRRFGFNGNKETLKEIGDSLHLIPGRISIIEAKALRKLRHPRISDSLVEFTAKARKGIELFERKQSEVKESQQRQVQETMSARESYELLQRDIKLSVEYNKANGFFQ